jgi:hypothetical protein
VKASSLCSIPNATERDDVYEVPPVSFVCAATSGIYTGSERPVAELFVAVEDQTALLAFIAILGKDVLYIACSTRRVIRA